MRYFEKQAECMGRDELAHLQGQRLQRRLFFGEGLFDDALRGSVQPWIGYRIEPVTELDIEVVEIAELADHPYMVGSQFHPEFLSRPNRPHPLFLGFMKAVSGKAGLFDLEVKSEPVNSSD